MKFLDLQAQSARVQPGVNVRLEKVFSSATFINGPAVVEFEKLSAEYLGYEHGVGVASGTDALLVSLMALGVSDSTKVFLPAYTYSATAEVICLLKATPIFLDVDPSSFLLDPLELDRALEKYSTPGDVVISVDLFGLPCDYDSIEKIVKKYDVRLIIDGAQSFGNTYKGSRSVSFADMFCTSFFPAKPLGCAGDGGAIYTNNTELSEVCRSIKNHGMGEDKYDIKRVGVNGRLDTIQAAVLIEKLAIFDDELHRKQQVLDHYKAAFSGCLKPQHVSYEAGSGHAQAVFRLPEFVSAVKLQAALKTSGVPTMIYYPKTVADQTAYSDKSITLGDLPISRGLCDKTIAMPFHAYLTEDELNLVVREVTALCESQG